ncbi:MAG: Fe-S-cluster-containing hydrogenase [Candidatus Kapabacteria bacterium]|nr:Fe-S-cluster-containing hydrogenase [Candidatus Kapabacteria bacterium]
MSDRSLHDSKNTTWKSFDELAQGPLETGEFAPGTTSSPVFDSTVSRRGFMTLVSASMALTAVACRRPEQKLVPSVKSLQNATPGLPVYYASVYAHRNVAYGALVKTREGRPIKVKGNELHPSNCGTASAEMQASLLAVYDPDRIRRPRYNKGQTSFDAAATKISEAMLEAQANGKKVAIIIDEHCSPTYSQLLSEFTTAVPNSMVVVMPSIVCDDSAVTNLAVLGVDGELAPDLSKASVILSVDSDFLGTDKLALYHTGRFAARRSPSSANASMSTLIVAESQFSMTGMNADQRVRLHPSQLESFLAVVERQIVSSGAIGGDLASAASAETSKAAGEVAARLKAAPTGEAVVLAGRHLSPRAQAIALSISNALGAVGAGKTIDTGNVIPNSQAKGNDIARLQSEMEAGNVHVALFCDTNPEYTSDRAFRSALAKVPIRAAVNLYEDETGFISQISIPAAHWLESWGTAVSFDGTLSIQQPMIAPLCEGVPSIQDTLITVGKKVNSAFLGEVATYADYVKNWVNTSVIPSRAGLTWTKAMQDGVIAPATPNVGPSAMNISAGAGLPTKALGTGMILLTTPAISIYDGKLANNGWLQEMPDPVTKITWDNVALMSPGTAVAMGLAASKDAKAITKANEKVVTVTTDAGAVDLPVIVQPGMADNVIVTQLGYGRTGTGKVAEGVGVNAYTLAHGSHSTSYVNVKSTVVVEGKRHRVATTQQHHTLSDGHGDRPVAKMMTLADVKAKNFEVVSEHFNDQGMDGKFKTPLSLNPGYVYKGHRWGMVIDMSSCTGCSSCIVACQSENNIPVVGKDQVLAGREMHWIRLDRYFTGDMDSPGAILEPMLCQHCENAPCENVCPVAATTHSPEGLNEMTYNRCVGTRYCLNNCPYKVRRFNFLNYAKENEQKPLDLAYNPDVTVRFRGVMEKCTFCVQRLHEAKWHARDNGRARVEDGEAVTACQEACPASAIIFGDMNDPKSRVSVARQNERGFRVLSDINVRPSVTYLAKVVNGNS